jgi:hypothetical protein
MCDIDVVSIFADALDEAEILAPLNRRANALDRHVIPPECLR